MNIKKFIAILNDVKQYSLYLNQHNIRVSTNKEHTKQYIHADYICKCCNTRIKKGVHVIFYSPHQLTIFEGNLLYNLFVENKKTVSYSNYCKCIAGQEFIANVKEVQT